MEVVCLVAAYTVWTVFLGVIPMLVFLVCGYMFQCRCTETCRSTHII